MYKKNNLFLHRIKDASIATFYKLLYDKFDISILLY
jgi:hypothetical protein